MKKVKVTYVLNGTEAEKILSSAQSVKFLTELKKEFLADPWFKYYPELVKLWNKDGLSSGLLRKKRELEDIRSKYLMLNPELFKPELKVTIQAI